MDDIHDYYSSADQFHGTNGRTVEATPYLDPVKAISQLAEDDYEVPPHDQSHLSDLFDDVKYVVTGYPLPTNNGGESNAMESNVLPVGIPEDEQIYEDPGHKKEEIYEWFEQRNTYKIDKNSVR